MSQRLLLQVLDLIDDTVSLLATDSKSFLKDCELKRIYLSVNKLGYLKTIDKAFETLFLDLSFMYYICYEIINICK